jgi:hypothetical protein
LRAFPALVWKRPHHFTASLQNALLNRYSQKGRISLAEQKPSNKEKLKEIISSIETGIQELFQSEKFTDYLRTMSRFHKYSVNNTVLIHLQRPNAAMPVAGFRKWQQFGRYVKKGEKGLTIIAPTPCKKKIEEMRLDPDTKAPILDQDGNAIMDEKIIEIPLFKPVKVFSADQTDGEPLPSLVADLSGDVQQYEAFMEALRRTSPMPIVFGTLEPGTDGLCSFSKQRITIREGMSQVQTVCATVHEIGHAFLYLDGDMLPLSQDRAAELLARDFTVYAIMDGGSAEMVFDRDELDEHPPDRIYAVSKEEWEASPDFRQAVVDRMDRQADRERAFLDHQGDCYAIYQLRHDDSTHNLRYEPLENLRNAGESPLKGNYELVYTGDLSPGQDLGVLDVLFTRFNTDHPADYQRPSMSISDIVALKLDGVVSCHYVDRLAFTSLPGFFQAENYLKNAEMAVEDDYNMIDGINPEESVIPKKSDKRIRRKGPTVAELEAQVKAGQNISLMDLAGAIKRESQPEKKSVVKKLQNSTKQGRKQSAQKKNTEKER